MGIPATPKPDDALRFHTRLTCSGAVHLEHRADAADAEGKNQVLNVEACGVGKTKQARRVPVGRDGQWLGQAKRCGEEARPNHDPSMP